MQYQSTRGTAPVLDFEQTTLTGLAEDGGLYIPRNWPRISEYEIRRMGGMTYSEVAFEILKRFVGQSIPPGALREITHMAYKNFRHPDAAPIKQLDEQLYFMELFHGPTLAFKDFALQILGRFFQFFLERNNAACTIVGATSGDTGSAAIAGVRGLPGINLFMLHPRGRISDVQRKQMTSVFDDNIHNLAVDGTFDDCQNLVKALFNDHGFRRQYALSAVNSINWARIAAQVVYYFRAGLALGAPGREISFSVPTGNFGNVLAGYVSRRMGLPIKKLIIGSNRNDILTRFFETGAMEMKSVTPTTSPSMDIQISSNFERYLFELLDHDSERLVGLMREFSVTGKFSIEKSLLKKAKKCFSAYRFDDSQAAREVLQIYRSTGEIIDPHSIIGVSAAKQENDRSVPTVVLGTAHPAKFPDAVKQSADIDVDLPDPLRALMSMPEKLVSVENRVQSVKRIIQKNVRPVSRTAPV